MSSALFSPDHVPSGYPSGPIPSFLNIDGQQTVPGYSESITKQNCPVFVKVTYYCEDSPLESGVQFVSVNAQTDFAYIAENTSNVEQIKITDIILIALGIDPSSDVSDWAQIYTDFNAFLLANPNYILDVSNMGITSTSIFSTFTNLKGLNASHNLLGMTDLDRIMDYGISLTYIDLSYNNLGGDAGLRLAPMKPSLKHVDLSHNLLNEASLYALDQNSIYGGPTPFLVDYYNVSFNNLAYIANGGARIKEFYMTDNTFLSLGIPGYEIANDFLDTSYLGTHFQDSTVIDLSNTIIRYSYNSVTDPNQVETEINTLLSVIVAAGHTSSQAKVILVRDPKWEIVEALTPHTPPSTDTIYVATTYVAYTLSDLDDSTIQLEESNGNIELEDSGDLVALE